MSGHHDSDPDYVPADGGELLCDAKGNPITSEYIERAVREAEDGFELATARRVDRSSLCVDPHRSTHISFGMQGNLRVRAEQAAQREGKSVSQLAREALERYLA